MTSPADLITTNNAVVLEWYRKTHLDFVLALLPAAVGVAIVSALPLVLLEWLAPRPLASMLWCALAACLGGRLAKDDWEGIGQREVRLEMSRQRLIVEQHFPHQKRLQSCEIPFRDLLLLLTHETQYDGTPAALSLRLQISKNVTAPSTAGYLLHREYAHPSPEAAERAMAERISKVVSITKIELHRG